MKLLNVAIETPCENCCREWAEWIKQAPGAPRMEGFCLHNRIGVTLVLAAGAIREWWVWSCGSEEEFHLRVQAGAALRPFIRGLAQKGDNRGEGDDPGPTTH